MNRRTPDAISDMLSRKSKVHIICPVNDEQVYESVLYASLQKNNYASLTKVVGATSAAQAFNNNIVNHPAGEITVLVHQDVFIPPHWTDRLEAIFDNVKFGVAGCAGYGGNKLYTDVYGSSTAYLGFNVEHLPAKVDSLDELILIFPSDTPIRLDEDLGWHMYGADACVKSKKLGTDALVIKNRVAHYSNKTGLDPSFHISAEIFRDKNPGRIVTTIIAISDSGVITYL
jgi:hypothetical protein